MTPVELTNLYALAKKVQRSGNFMRMDPATILALLDIEKAQGVTIRELEDENTELNDELGSAVQMLKLERDAALAEVERLQEESARVLKASGLIRAEYRAKVDRLLDQRNDLVERWTSLRARLAAVVHAHADYFDMDGRPGFDETEPEPEDVWRYDRDFRAALTEGDAPGPDPDGGLDLTDEEFAAFLKAAKA